MTMASLMKELYIALGVIVVIAAGVFFLWRRHRKNAAKALQVSSSKTAVEKKNKKGEIIHIKRRYFILRPVRPSGLALRHRHAVVYRHTD